MRKSFRIIFFLLSIVLYIKSPNDYDFNFCLLCMILYLLEVGIVVGSEIKQGNLFTYNLVFFFSFFWTSFAYPVFVYDTPAGYLNKMVDHIDWSVLSHSTSLCLVFASTFLLAYGKPSETEGAYQVNTFRTTNGRSNRWLKVAFILHVIQIFAYLLSSGFDYEVFSSINLPLWDIYYILLIYCLIEKSKFKSPDCGFKEFLLSNKFALLSAGFLLLLFLTFGDRGPALKILLICCSIYNCYYKKLKISQVAIAGCIGLVLMFLIRQTRGDANLFELDKSSIEQAFNLKGRLIYVFADLYGISMELNIAYDYAQHHALFHPERILVMPLSCIPYLPTIVLGIFGLTIDDFNTGLELNRQMAAYDPHFGTHIVGDLYMSTGVIGVIVFAFLLGSLVKAFAKKRKSNEMYAVAYIMLFAVSLYLPRDSVFSLVRPIAFCFIILYFLLPKKKYL